MAPTLGVTGGSLGKLPPMVGATLGSLPDAATTLVVTRRSLPCPATTLGVRSRSLPWLITTVGACLGSLPYPATTVGACLGSLPCLATTVGAGWGSLPWHARTVGPRCPSLLSSATTLVMTRGSGFWPAAIPVARRILRLPVLAGIVAFHTPLPMPAPNWDEFHWDEDFWDGPPPPAFALIPETKKHTNPRTMASNPTPEDDDVLIALTEDLADGCHLHEVAIGIKQNTEAVMRAAITATNTALQAVGAASGLVDGKFDMLQGADAAGKAVLMNCRLRLVKVLGTQFNSGWEEAGWPNQSTAVPDNQDQRFTLLGSMKGYLTTHPTAESADMEATAAICQTAHEAVSTARAGVNTAEAAETEARKVAKATLKTLRKRVRGLIDELGTLVADDDVRYEAFGLTIPADPNAPEPIETLTLTAMGGGKVFAEWSYATRSTGTRLSLKRVGVDTEFASLGTFDGLEKMLAGQAVGQTLQIYAVAYNDGGDAAPSPTASVVVA